MSRVLVLGNATIDLIQRVERLPRPGETVLSTQLQRCAGGKGLNQAVAAARTGAPVTLTAPIGRDRDGCDLAAWMDAEPGLETDWHRVAAQTDVSAIWVAPDGENMIASTAAAAGSLTPAAAHQACAGLAAADILLMQGNLSRQATREAAGAARARGARTIINTAPIAWDMSGIGAFFDTVIANEIEAAGLVGPPPGPSCVLIVTLGAAGARMVTQDGSMLIAAPKVAAVDTAGAGDVLAGTLAGLLAQDLAMPDALAVAVAAAALSVTRHGTTPSFPRAAEIRALIAAARLSPPATSWPP